MFQRMSWSSAAVILMLAAMQMFICRAANNEDFADFKISKLGDTGILQCNSTDSVQATAIPPFYEPVAWMLPNLSRVYESTPKFELSENNWTLVVSNTSLADVGVYHCMLLNNSEQGTYYLVKVGLNAEGPYFFDMWEKYMWPTIIGICCFFGFLLLAAIAVILFRFRYIPLKEEDERESDSEAEVKAEADSEKVAAVTDDGIAASLPPYNGDKAPHTYENPSFQEEVHGHEPKDSEHDVSRDSDDEDLTSL